MLHLVSVIQKNSFTSLCLYFKKKYEDSNLNAPILPPTSILKIHNKYPEIFQMIIYKRNQR